MIRLTRLFLMLFIIALIGLFGETLYGQDSNAAKRLAAPVAGLNVVSFPGFEGIEPAAAEQLKSVRDSLYKEATNKETTNIRLAAAYGFAGRTYHAYSMFETAVDCYRNAAALEPNDFRWRHVLGLVLLEINKPYDAVSAFKDSNRLNARFVPSLVTAGNIYLDLGLYGLAAESFRAAFALKPEDPAVLFGLGQIEYEKKKYELAAGYFEQVLALVPRANRVHYVLALSYRNLKQNEKAREHFAKQGEVGIKVADPLLESIEQLRVGTRPRLLEAKTAMDTGQFDAAAAIYSQILKSEPDNIIALVNIGGAFLRLGKPTEAVAAFEKVITLEPDNTNARFNLGVIYSLAGKPFQAISHFKALLAIRPDDLGARQRLASQLRKADLLDESLKEYQYVVAKAPENEDAFLDLISLMSEKGMHRELFSLLKSAHEQFPSRGQTAAAYAFALSSSPVTELRDGELALEISRDIYSKTKLTEHGILVMLSLAELGLTDNAVELGQSLIKKAQQEKRDDLVNQLTMEIDKIVKAVNDK